MFIVKITKNYRVVCILSIEWALWLDKFRLLKFAMILITRSFYIIHIEYLTGVHHDPSMTGFKCA